MRNVPKIRVVQVMPWFFALVIATFAGGTARAADASVGNCHVGAYRLANGSVVDIGPSEGAHLRWRRDDGTTGQLTSQADGTWTSTLGWTGKPDGIKVKFSDCAKGRIDFNGTQGQRIAFDVALLHGRVIGAGHDLPLAERFVVGGQFLPQFAVAHPEQVGAGHVLHRECRRCLARPHRQRRDATLERRDALLERIAGRVHDAAVDVAERLQREQAGRVIGVIERV